MTLIQKLDDVLAPMNMPFYPDEYEGKGTEYGIYDNFRDSGELFCDNSPDYSVITFRVHIYVLSDRIKKKNKVKTLLRSAGFLIGDITEQKEKDTGYTHYTFEVETYETEGGEE